MPCHQAEGSRDEFLDQSSGWKLATENVCPNALQATREISWSHPCAGADHSESCLFQELRERGSFEVIQVPRRIPIHPPSTKHPGLHATSIWYRYHQNTSIIQDPPYFCQDVGQVIHVLKRMA